MFVSILLFVIKKTENIILCAMDRWMLQMW